MSGSACRAWAREEFGHTRLGDERRTTRVVSMAATALSRPGGRVSDVFIDDAERQGAYDFLESDAVHADALMAAMGEACARRCADHRYVFVPVDGSSLTLTDTGRRTSAPSAPSRPVRGASSSSMRSP